MAQTPNKTPGWPIDIDRVIRKCGLRQVSIPLFACLLLDEALKRQGIPISLKKKAHPEWRGSSTPRESFAMAFGWEDQIYSLQGQRQWKPIIDKTVWDMDKEKIKQQGIDIYNGEVSLVSDAKHLAEAKDAYPNLSRRIQSACAQQINEQLNAGTVTAQKRAYRPGRI